MSTENVLKVENITCLLYTSCRRNSRTFRAGAPGTYRYEGGLCHVSDFHRRIICSGGRRTADAA